jgi:hypothetical protein
MERARVYTESVPQSALALPVPSKQAGTALQAGAQLFKHASIAGG